MSRYTQTFLWLQQYDEGLLNEPKGEDGGVLPSAEQAMASLNALKISLAVPFNGVAKNDC